MARRVYQFFGCLLSTLMGNEFLVPSYFVLGVVGVSLMWVMRHWYGRGHEGYGNLVGGLLMVPSGVWFAAVVVLWVVEGIQRKIEYWRGEPRGLIIWAPRKRG